MKKILYLIIMTLLFANIAPAETNENETYKEKTGMITNVSSKIYEMIIKRELKQELNSDFKVKLGIYSLASLKNGIFKSLSLQTDKLNYSGISLSKISAETKNENNKVIYKDKKLYFPEEIPLKFKAVINNEDIKNIISSDIFALNLAKINSTFGVLFVIRQPEIEIKNSKIYFDIPVKPLFTENPINVKMNADVYIENNELMLKNISNTVIGSIINLSGKNIDEIIRQINPLKIKKDTFSTKFCKILIESAKPEGEIINLTGELIINTNKGDGNE